jgi:ATP-dependent Clp protease ATP-binding subunit ClpX
MLDVMYELPNRDDVGEVIIDAPAVAGERRPRFRRRRSEVKPIANLGHQEDAA